MGGVVLISPHQAVPRDCLALVCALGYSAASGGMVPAKLRCSTRLALGAGFFKVLGYAVLNT
jgi:hypothetical protein